MKKLFQKFGLFCDGSETYDSMPYKFAIGDRVKILLYEPKYTHIGEVVDFSYYTVFGIRKQEYEVEFEGSRGGLVRHWYELSELENYDKSKERDYKLDLLLNQKESV
jgi:hypothetical protein